MRFPSADEQQWPVSTCVAGFDAYMALVRRAWAQNKFDRPTFSELLPELR